MRASHNDLLCATFAEVMQKQVFLFADPLDAGEIETDESTWSQVQIAFHGPSSGSLTLSLPKELGHEVTANFLGLDPGEAISDRQADDAVRELLNVLCGHFLSAYAGEEAVFDLGAPAAKSWESEPSPSADSVQGFDVEGKPALLTLNISST